MLKRTRPLCAYPQIARYKGTGDKDSASSFICVADWNGFERDFAEELHNILSAVKHGDLRNLPN
jgi:hypothetical protein